MRVDHPKRVSFLKRKPKLRLMLFHFIRVNPCPSVVKNIAFNSAFPLQ